MCVCEMFQLTKRARDLDGGMVSVCVSYCPACERERKRERESLCVCVCVCARGYNILGTPFVSMLQSPNLQTQYSQYSQYSNLQTCKHNTLLHTNIPVNDRVALVAEKHVELRSVPSPLVL